MAMAADTDFYDCKDCKWKFYVDAPKPMYGTMTAKRSPVCPQCGSASVVKC